jgi:outer membrane protein assembly factor BamE (lipoprotein component of BamABCDE complex)
MIMTAAFCSGCPFYFNKESMTLAWNPQYQPLTSEIEDSRNIYNLKKLQKGMTREDVYTIMGMPDLYDMYETVDRDYLAVFYYYTYTRVDDGAAAKNECTPVVIRNGKLVGWGNEFLKKQNEFLYLR